MKKLKIIGLNGVILSEALVNLKGDDFCQTFAYPTLCPIISISLEEIKKKSPLVKRRRL